VGTVFDAGQEPSWVNGVAYGYVTPNTLSWLGGAAGFNQLRIVVSEDALDRSHIRQVAERLSASLQRDGDDVDRIEVPNPGKSQETDATKTLLFSLEAFGLLALLLSGLMTATLISSLLSQQVRRIGVMKAIGASTRQVMTIYFGTVLALALTALVIGIPLGVLAGRAFAIPVMEFLNFEVASGAIPLWAYVVQVALGVLVPLLTAAYPVYRGSRVTVHEAISDYGIDQKTFGTGRLDRWLGRLPDMPRSLTLSLRNTFRHRGRIVVTLVMLAAGGASFISALGSAASWDQTIDDTFATINYDIDVRFARPYATDAIEKSVRAIPGVTGVEPWGYLMSTAFPRYSDGTYGGPYAVLAPPADTALIDPPLFEGRWLRPDDTNALVVDADFIENAMQQGTPVELGDELTLNLNGEETTWQIVGIVGKIGFQSAAYVSYDYLAEIMDQQGLAASVRVVVEDHDKTLQASVSRILEQRLAEDGFDLFVVQDLSSARQLMENHVILILVFLMLMSILVAAVGALGLASTMGVNVMERAREFGIMRSVGASTGVIVRIVIVEGVIIGVLSWLVGAIVSIPVTNVIAGTAGSIFLSVPMTIVIPLWAPALWLGIVIAVAIAASYFAATGAARLTVREVLAYE
jgi:putative ABC transport system permease protein